MKDLSEKSFKTKFNKQEYDKFWQDLASDMGYAELMVDKLLGAINKAENELIPNKSFNQEYVYCLLKYMINICNIKALTTLYTIFLFQLQRVTKVTNIKNLKESNESKSSPF